MTGADTSTGTSRSTVVVGRDVAAFDAPAMFRAVTDTSIVCPTSLAWRT